MLLRDTALYCTLSLLLQTKVSHLCRLTRSVDNYLLVTHDLEEASLNMGNELVPKT
jgi:ABC-type taurine transport system ATPase subunit